MPVDNEHVEQTVRRYYRLIDGRDVDGVVAIFSSAAVYQRPGYPPLHGAGTIRRFYENERVIAEGRHTLSNVVAERGRCAVEGLFEGRLRNGSDVSVRFADFWTFDDAQLVVARDTYFFTASV